MSDSHTYDCDRNDNKKRLTTINTDQSRPLADLTGREIREEQVQVARNVRLRRIFNW